MKPFAYLMTIILAIVSLVVVVWVGQYGAGGLLKPPSKTPQVPTAQSLPVPTSGPLGKAQIEQTVFDFGSRVIQTQDKHIFTMKNAGEGPLELKMGKPSCQCTGVDWAKSKDAADGLVEASPGDQITLAPNETIDIRVKWEMKSEAEKFRTHVPVFTTDPDKREVDLEITGRVDHAVHLIPGVWDLGELNPSEPTHGEGFAFSAVLDSFELEEVPREKSQTKVTIEPADREFLDSKTDPQYPQTSQMKCGYIIRVEIPANVPIGLYRDSIKLKATASIDKLNEATGAAAATEPADALAPKNEEKQNEVQPRDAEHKDGENKDGEHHEESSEKDLTVAMLLEFSVVGRRTGPIEVRGRIGAGFNPNSNQLIFSDFPAAQGKKAILTFFVKGMDEDLVLKSYESANPRLKAVQLDSGKKLGNAKAYQIEIEIPPGPPGKHRKENAEILDLKLNHPEVPDFRLLIDYTATN